jgi:hypothetical protein
MQVNHQKGSASRLVPSQADAIERNRAELETKTIILDPDAPPEFERHALIPALAKASVQSDLRRLWPKPIPDWARPWVRAKKRI